MNKSHLIHMAIKSIRNDLELFNSSATNGNAELSRYYSNIVCGKASLLLDMRLISLEQWKTLSSIIDRAIIKGCA